jgi:O-antigen ligase
VTHDLFLTGRPGLYAFVYPALVVAVWVLQPRLKELWPMAVTAGALAAVSLLLGALVPEQGILTNAAGDAVDPTKQVLPWGVLVGPLTSGNNLGQVLALSIPATLLLPRRARPATIALIMLPLLWTASRSSIVAALAVGLAVLVVTKVVPDLRAGLAGLISVVSLGVAGLVPFLTHDDAAYTNRGYIWRRSIEAWQESPFVGLGSDYYTRIGGSSDAIVETAYHGHNEVIQLLVTGGWVLLTLFLLLVLTTIVVAARCAGRGEYFPLGLVVALLLSSTFEVSLGFIDRQFVLPAATLPLAVVLLSPDSARRRDRRPVPVVQQQVTAPRDVTTASAQPS